MIYLYPARWWWWCVVWGGDDVLEVVEVVAPHHVLPPCFLLQYWQLAASHSQTVDIWFLHWSDKYPVIQCFHSQNLPPATAQQVGRRRKENINYVLASRQDLVLVYTVSVLTGIDPCLHCIAGTLLTLRPSIPLLSPGETGPLLSGLPPMYNNNIRPRRTKFTDKYNFWIFIFFFPNKKILMDLLA